MYGCKSRLRAKGDMQTGCRADKGHLLRVTYRPGIPSKSRYHADCTGDIHNNVTVQSNTDGMCIDTDCQVASLDIASAGNCPNGQVQISYWEQPGCSGKWYGYGYTNRGTCRSLWSEGWKFKSLWVRCAEQGKDCVNQKTCVADAEPTSNIC